MNIQQKLFSTFSDWHMAYVKNRPFQAIKWDGEYRPFEPGEKDVFVYGMGRKKIGKNAITVPAVSELTDLSDYLNKYGPSCLFYALTGREPNSGDCCYTDLNCEFSAMVSLGLDKWLPYMERVNALKVKINQIYLDKYGIEADNEKMQTTKQGNLVFRDKMFTVWVRHYIVYSFRSKPHFNPVEDDDRLVSTYVNCELSGEWGALEKDTIFPESVKDRLTYLFDEDVSNEYKSLMHYFGL